MSVELDREIHRLLALVVDEAPPAPHPEDPSGPGTTTWAPPVRIGRGWLTAAVSAAAVILVLGTIAVLTNAVGTSPITEPADGLLPVMEVPGATEMRVSVSGLKPYVGQHFAAILYEGTISDLESEAVGGAALIVDTDEETIGVLAPQDPPMGTFSDVSQFPWVGEPLPVPPGTYTLVLWMDTALNPIGFDPIGRWIPVNTDGRGLVGCHLPVTIDGSTIEVAPTFEPNGWNVHCETGDAIPGTDADKAVVPEAWVEGWGMAVEEALPPIIGETEGSLAVGVSGPEDRLGDHLAALLFEGNTVERTNPIGGFWIEVGTDVAPETLRAFGSEDRSEDTLRRFPYVTDEAAIVPPGEYTLVIWVDTALNSSYGEPTNRWTPINTDELGLAGCHLPVTITETPVTIRIEPRLSEGTAESDC